MSIENEMPIITHNGEKYICYLAAYNNPMQHKWSFVIDGTDSLIKSGESILFFDIEMKVCFSQRREANITRNINKLSGRETYFEAWII